MKRFLMIVILIVTCISLVGCIFGFFNALEDGLASAVFNLVVGLVTLCPYIAIVILLRNVDNLEMRIYYLEDELIRNDHRDNPTQTGSVPEKVSGSNALTEWSCPKCGTVNKKGSANCEYCGAAH